MSVRIGFKCEKWKSNLHTGNGKFHKLTFEKPTCLVNLHVGNLLGFFCKGVGGWGGNKVHLTYFMFKYSNLFHLLFHSYDRFLDKLLVILYSSSYYPTFVHKDAQTLPVTPP